MSLAVNHLIGFGARRASVAGGEDLNTKLLLHMDGADASTTFTDASPTARGNATVNGNAQVDTAQSVFGGASLLLDGSGDYLSYASNADWNLGAAGGGNFTIDFRIRFAATGTNVLVGASNAPDAASGWALYVTGSTIRLYNGTESTLTWSRSTSVWYHVALIRSGSTITCYIDGTSIGTFTDIDMNNDSGALGIGSSGSGAYNLNGWIDEFRLVKGAAKWTANFTPPASAYV
jgi:hypothetical protein